MAKKNVSIEASVGETFEVSLKARKHELIIDQTESGGGKDKGPSPLEYLFFALGGCICTVARIVAKQQRLEVRNVTTRVEGELDLDVLMGKNKEARPGFSGIKVYTKIDADMTREEKEAFLKEVDARCPVSDNLHGQTPVEVVIDE